MKEQIEILKNTILQEFENKNWLICKCEFSINRSSVDIDKAGMVMTRLVTLDFKNKLHIEDKRILMKSKKLKNELIEKYETSISDIETRFNNFEIEIFLDGNYKERYWWDNAKEYDAKLTRAKYFYHYINEIFIERIFDYEYEHNLLPTRLDDDGELEYLSSWDEGIFTFIIIARTVEIKIELVKDGKIRLFDSSYFVGLQEIILEHYTLTNEELKEWLPWNKLVIKSPHKEITSDMVEDHVSYSIGNDDVA